MGAGVKRTIKVEFALLIINNYLLMFGRMNNFGPYPFRRSGFTLIELAIVMVVIGLIAGGVVVGRDLIRQTELRSVAADVDKIIKSIDMFSEKYQSLPGDMPDATQFWGALGPPATCKSVASTNNNTCDGTGDGKIDYDGSGDFYTYYEYFHFWIHLSNSGFIPGQFTGVAAAANDGARPGVNVLASKMGNAGYTVIWRGMANAGDMDYVGNYDHRIEFGTSNGNRTYREALRPAEALQIDQKLDDGLPGNGKVRSWKPAMNPNCATSADPTVARYDVVYSDISCALIFVTGF